MYSSVIKSCLSLFSKCSSSTLAHTRDIQSYYRCKWRHLHAWKILKDLQLRPFDFKDPVMSGLNPRTDRSEGKDHSVHLYHLSIFATSLGKIILMILFQCCLFPSTGRVRLTRSTVRPFPYRDFEYGITLFDPRRWFSKVLISQDWSPSVHSAFPTK